MFSIGVKGIYEPKGGKEILINHDEIFMPNIDHISVFRFSNDILSLF